MRRRSKKTLAGALVALLLAAGLCLAALWQAYRVYPFWPREHINACALEQGLDPLLVAALIRTESLYQSDAISRAGAVGMMQLMPATAQWMCQRLGLQYAPELMLDAESNIYIGCAYLKYLFDRFGDDTELVLAAYNAGEGRVREWLRQGTPLRIPFEETRDYVRKVLHDYEIYSVLYKNEANS